MNRGVLFSVLTGMAAVFVTQCSLYVWQGATTTGAILWSIVAGFVTMLLTSIAIDWARR